MKYELSLKQKQKLILTPQLYQAINILQLNLLELRNLINKELMENPLLEVNQVVNPEAENVIQKEDSDNKIENQDKEAEENNFKDWLSYLEEKDYQPFLEKSISKKENTFENFVHYGESLQDYLLIQLGTTVNNNIDYKIGEYLIGNIDDNGYLTISLEDISYDLNVKIDKIEEILLLIQSFDPPGVGARNLEECLLIQAKYLGINNVYIEKIIKDHLNDLARKAYQKIAKDLEISVSEIQSLADIIKNNFDPKPGRGIGNLKETKYVIPDLTLRREECGRYRLLLNEDYLPQIRINPLYKRYLYLDNIKFPEDIKELVGRKDISGHETKDTIEYIKEKLQSARSLIKGIEQRKKTVYQIAEILIDYQKDFLNKGILYIKPLSLKEVADKLGINESTVSRAIHNKIIQTPRGVFKMKFFFSKGVNTKEGDIVSTDRVRRLIKEFIEKENPLKPWSDQKLTELLSKKEKIKISRRTVTKYREMLKIPSSNKRKRFEI